MGLPNMLRPSMQTLKNLRVNMTYGIGSDDPLGGFPVELEAMQNHNVIETIAIQVYIEVDIASHWDFGIGDEWGLIDEALSHSGWPKLQRVSLEITVWSFFTLERALECELNELPETQFPKLSSNKNLSFEFSVEIDGEFA
jgi:hypothetical protein